MEPITLAMCLRRLRETSLRGPFAGYYGGLFWEQSGAPDASTPINSPFCIDTDTDNVFYNQARTPDGWLMIIDTPTLTDGETVVTATTT